MKKITGRRYFHPDELKYQITTVNPSNILLVLKYHSEILDKDEYEYKLPSSVEGSFFFDGSTNIQNELVKGNFDVEVSFDLMQTEYKAIILEIQNTQLIKSQVEAFKEVIEKKSTTGGKFLFFDWRKSVTKKIINQKKLQMKVKQVQPSIHTFLLLMQMMN